MTISLNGLKSQIVITIGNSTNFEKEGTRDGRWETGQKNKNKMIVTKEYCLQLWETEWKQVKVKRLQSAMDSDHFKVYKPSNEPVTGPWTGHCRYAVALSRFVKQSNDDRSRTKHCINRSDDINHGTICPVLINSKLKFVWWTRPYVNASRWKLRFDSAQLLCLCSIWQQPTRTQRPRRTTPTVSWQAAWGGQFGFVSFQVLCW